MMRPGVVRQQGHRSQMRVGTRIRSPDPFNTGSDGGIMGRPIEDFVP